MGRAAFRQFSDFETDRPADAEGFPVPKKLLRGVQLKAGLTVSLPARGVVVLTTLGGGSAVTLTHGVQAPVTSLTVRGSEGMVQVARGDSLPMEAIAVPDNGHVRWSVTDTGGKPTDRAVLTPAGLLTARKLGTVRVTAIAASGVAASTVIDITQGRVIVDTLTDWDKTYSHTEGLTFETIHPALFEGSPSHLKRTRDTPESVVYHAPGLTALAVRAYSVGPLAGKLRAEASPDGVAWAAVPLGSDAPVPTSQGFERTDLHPTRLPSGTNYLRLTLSGDPLAYSPQISRVTLTARPGKSVTTDPLDPNTGATAPGGGT